MTGGAILTLQGVSKSFGGVMAVRDLSLSVPPGSICGLIGPNGAGKTTVFNLVTGAYPCTRGSIFFRDEEVTRLQPHRITRLGIARTFQTIRLFANLSAWEHVLVGQNFLGKRDGRRGWPSAPHWERGRIDEAEEIVGLLGLERVKEHKASTLPYGIQRKVEIARALATRPSLLLLDEPAAGLNIQESEELLTTLHRIHERGVSLLIIEHDMRVIMGLCHHIFVLNFGEKIAEGTADQIRASDQVIEAYLGSEE